MQMPPQAVIFDLDGCLVDSETLSIGALVAQMQALQIEGVTFEDIRARFLGVSMQVICAYAAEKSGKPCAPQSFIDNVETRLFASYRAELQCIPGAVQMLETLTSQGVAMAIATGGSIRRMQETLRVAALAPWFEGRAFSADQVARGKPAPDLFLLAAQALGVPPAACVVVEDSPHGVVGARAAGMQAIGFIGGSHLDGIRDAHTSALLESGACRVEQSLSDVLAAILGVDGPCGLEGK